MKLLKGTETKINIAKAFIGESQARNKYTFFASVARKEGYYAIASIFEETANHEKEHAKRLFNFFDDEEELIINNNWSFKKIGTTAENLQQAINGEHEENTIMYPTFAKIAKQEGFTEIASVMENIGKAEIYHEKRFQTLLNSIEVKEILKENNLIVWKCINCGFHITSKNAPKKCPACGYEQGYFIPIIDELF